MLNSIYRKIFPKTTPAAPIASDLEPVYFFTFHKCASSLFSNYILKNINGLHNYDIASDIYNGRISDSESIDLSLKGTIYGPIRLSARKDSDVYSKLVIPTCEKSFIRDKTAIFFIRDPRDILVSSYYSFGFSHKFSKVEKIRKEQEARRKNISSKTIDEYVLSMVDEQIDNFNDLLAVKDHCPKSVILRYEDMINDFETFKSQLCTYLSIDDEVMDKIYKKSRPKEKESIDKHKRSGKVHGYKDKLKQETIEIIDTKTNLILSRLGYN